MTADARVGRGDHAVGPVTDRAANPGHREGAAESEYPEDASDALNPGTRRRVAEHAGPEDAVGLAGHPVRLPGARRRQPGHAGRPVGAGRGTAPYAVSLTGRTDLVAVDGCGATGSALRGALQRRNR